MIFFHACTFKILLFKNLNIHDILTVPSYRNLQQHQLFSRYRVLQQFQGQKYFPEIVKFILQR